MHKRTALLSLFLVSQGLAFCGFFVAKADTKLFNHANQVIIARQGDRSVFTMMNDFGGDVKDFARIVPIPVVPKREDISIGDPNIVKKLEAYSAPRLVEYFDEDPCNPPPVYMTAPSAAGKATAEATHARADALGVKIEAEYQVGEYDVQILSAQQQSGLATYLRGEGYKLPAGADAVLGSYLRGGMKFFVVKVNLERFDQQGLGFLNPIVLRYKSSKFMLPIRLGTLNSPGEQDLTLYLLSSEGRVETSNYRTVPLPTDKEVPLFIKKDFGNFYKDLFKTAYQREGKSVAFLEYAWNTSWCDPCAAEPPSDEELRKAGAFWLDGDEAASASSVKIAPGGPRPPLPPPPPRDSGVFLTRLHIRYTAKTFPQDLHFKITPNQDTFQGRYIVRHPYNGPARCAAAKAYLMTLKDRQQQQAKTLANLTDWNIGEIRRRMEQP